MRQLKIFRQKDTLPNKKPGFNLVLYPNEELLLPLGLYLNLHNLR